MVAWFVCGVLPTACIEARTGSDIGGEWIGGPSTKGISWLGWSPDGATLYWIGGTNKETLYGSRMGAGSPVVMATGVSPYPSPTLLAEGSAIFYMTFDPWASGGALVEATITGDGTALAGTHSVAGDLFSYCVARDGRRVALMSASTGKVTIRDLITGTTVALGGYPDPAAFAPDGATLLARNAGANDESTHYFLIDAATGLTKYLSFPMNRIIEWVTVWDHERPRVVISNDEVIDLQSGSALRLAGMGRVDALSVTSARAFGYGWGDIDCLDPYTDAETGDEVCSAFTYRLSRDDLSGGAREVIAAELIEPGNNVDIFAASPDDAWLAVAAGSGLLVRQGPTAINLKRLSPP